MRQGETDVTTPVGGYILAADPVKISPGRPRRRIAVRNTGDRPVQVASHFHFFEVNRYLEYDREQAFGHRLDIPAGTAVRFEPGDEREVTLVPFGGKRRVHGFNNLVDGWAPVDGSYRPGATQAIRLAAEYGFRSRRLTRGSRSASGRAER
jgi:urease subunit beta